MLGYQITHCLLTVQHKARKPYRFIGLFESSVNYATLEKSIEAEANWCAVLNVASTHWVVLCYDAERRLIIFGDSLGLDLAQYNLPLSSQLQTVFGAGHLIHLPSYPVQEADAQTCGLFVVFWVAELSRGVALSTLSSTFPPNRRRDNDRRVTLWFQETFPCLCTAAWI